MNKSKKSVELALTSIAVAALVLIVIVVSVIIFTGGSQKFAKTINNCEQNGGECVQGTNCDTQLLSYECTKGSICCTKKSGFV